MSFIWRLFRAERPPDDYETILSTLAANIQKRQTLLSEIRMRERKATMLVTLYAIAGWLVYLAVWYFGFVSGGASGRVRPAERAVRALPVFVGPIFILFIRRIVQIWYNRKGNAEEKTLQTLMKEQRAKVEEIKKKTNFYSTRELLSRYDASASTPNSPSGQRGAPPPQTPQRPGPAPPNQNQRPHAPSPLSVPPQQQQRAPAPTGPPERRWYDALADLLVGAEDASPASQRYALICDKCFAHNGLVPEAAWPDAQYTCPKCGHFNPSARSKRVLERGAASPISPTSPMSPAPPTARPSVGGSAPAGRPSVGGDSSASARESVGGGVRRRAPAGAGSGEGEGEVMMEVDS
ncbi:hypothetical protein FB451DRAFT_1277333 [Mycena latifolia]|nr:hypothetical protein FB451DRAFT_1277333 [Mycena latifolia]